MTVTRRMFLGSSLLVAAAPIAIPSLAHAQDATPGADDGELPVTASSECARCPRLS